MSSKMTLKLQGTVNWQRAINMEVFRNDYKLQPTPAYPLRKGGVFPDLSSTSPLSLAV